MKPGVELFVWWTEATYIPRKPHYATGEIRICVLLLYSSVVSCVPHWVNRESGGQGGGWFGDHVLMRVGPLLQLWSPPTRSLGGSSARRDDQSWMERTPRPNTHRQVRPAPQRVSVVLSLLAILPPRCYSSIGHFLGRNQIPLVIIGNHVSLGGFALLQKPLEIGGDLFG